MGVFEALKTFLVGHRGVPELELENTLQSIEKAIELGAHVVEVDIQRTRDGVFVLSHDDNLLGVFGVGLNIRDASWEEVAKVQKMVIALQGLRKPLSW